MNTTKYNLAKLILPISLFFSGFSQAEIVNTSIISKHFDVTVTPTLPSVQLNISPVSDIQSGTIEQYTILAKATASIDKSLNSDQLFAIRWTPGRSELGSTSNKATISGSTNPNSKIKVFVDNPAGWTGMLSDGWMGSRATSGNNFEFTIKADATQSIVADRYDLFLDAGVYTL